MSRQDTVGGGVASALLFISCGVAFFCLTGPIAKPFAMIAAFAFGFNAALCYARAILQSREATNG